MRVIFDALVKYGQPIEPSKGKATELCGVALELENPRARFSRSESRGRLFSALGELCWYLSGSNEASFITYYLPHYRKLVEESVIYGAYGPRLFNWHNQNQICNVIDLLKCKKDSRQAVIQVFDAIDLAESHKDVPCTCTLQFLHRDNQLNMIGYMRSNDVYFGFPHDIFCFTMIQEIIAQSIDAKLGTYTHIVGSLHMYDRDREAMEGYVDEGWQSTANPMPPMPPGDPWGSIDAMLKLERQLRDNEAVDDSIRSNLNEYWYDLSLLLEAFREQKERNYDRMVLLRKKFHSNVYKEYLRTKIEAYRAN